MDKPPQEEIARLKDVVRSLNHLVLSVQEEERRRIALDLHDQAGGLLAGLNLALHQLRVEVGDAHESCEKALSHAQSMVDRITEIIRVTTRRLRPPVLDEFGLAESLRQLAADSEVLNRLTVTVDMEEDIENRMDAGTQLVAYRIVQEALTNILRHAGATRATISVRADADDVHILIRDNGEGMDLAILDADRTTIGLTSILERAASVSGTATFDAREGAGTSLTVRLPLSY